MKFSYIFFLFSLLIVENANAKSSQIQSAIKALVDSANTDPASFVTTPNQIVPEVNVDDDGVFDFEEGCEGSGGPTDTCVQKNIIQRPSKTCGDKGSIQARVDDCTSKNGSSASVDLGANGSAGGVWQLVMKTSAGKEVWRDGRTRLLWSDQLGDLSINNNQGEFNWCVASGNTQDLSTELECQKALSTSYNTSAISLCAEVSGLTTPEGIHGLTQAKGISKWDNQGTLIADAKGNLTLKSSTVEWRLPTLVDWQAAQVNGIRQVLPNMKDYFWTATTSSISLSKAWVIHGGTGETGQSQRSEPHAVRCIGQ